MSCPYCFFPHPDVRATAAELDRAIEQIPDGVLLTGRGLIDLVMANRRNLKTTHRPSKPPESNGNRFECWRFDEAGDYWTLDWDSGDWVEIIAYAQEMIDDGGYPRYIWDRLTAKVLWESWA